MYKLVLLPGQPGCEQLARALGGFILVFAMYTSPKGKMRAVAVITPGLVRKGQIWVIAPLL